MSGISRLVSIHFAGHLRHASGSRQRRRPPGVAVNAGGMPHAAMTDGYR